MGTPVHIVSGFLGTGKTTALRARLAQCGNERVAVIVNDFGVAGLDEAALDSSSPFRIVNIPGGCVCCTAPEGFVQALGALLEAQPDRLLIEPTGLARPQDLVDTIRRGPYRDRLELQPVLVLIDPARLGRETPPEAELVLQQLEAADVVIVNRCDLAGEGDLARSRTRLEALWPPPIAVHWTQRGSIPEQLWSWPSGAEKPQPERQSHAHSEGHEGHAPAATPSTLGHRAVSKTWLAAELFSRSRLREILARLLAGEAGARAVRLKGIFRTREGWLRLEIAGGRVHEAVSAFRRDSRVDAIFATEAAEPAERALGWLEAARLQPAELTQLSQQLEIATQGGALRALDREQLEALPDGIPDVAALMPKRQGSAARIGALFDALGLARGGHAVVCASDGFASEPVAVEVLCQGVIVHSLAGEPLSEKQGGPFRLLIPDGVPGAPLACANVKGVSRIVLRDAAG